MRRTAVANQQPAAAGPVPAIRDHKPGRACRAALAASPAPDLLAAPLPVAFRRAAMVELARQAGNRAVQRALPPVDRSPVVQRFGAQEHLRLGDTTGRVIDIGEGVELTFGQIVALAGDEFGSEQALANALKTPDGRAMIRAHLERAGLPGPAKGSLPVPTAEQKSTASTEYVTLAMDNSTHFAGGGTAVEEWISHHARAVDSALQAGLRGDAALLSSANMTEAFGAHFLTDAFSSGHIRVPRQEIIDYYVGTLAPAVYDHLVDHLRDHLIDEIYDQVEQQTSWNEAAWVLGPIGGLGVREYMRGKISDAIDKKLGAAIAGVGGRATAVRYLGLGLAGLVSGALHDAENRDGLMVISEVHPDPWQAFGDGKLDDNPKHRQQVEAALAASVADLDKAHRIGVEEHQQLFNLPDVTWLPATVHFAFGQHDASSETVAAIEMVAHYMRYHHDTVVQLDGHTDPIGTDADNDALSAARAAAVEGILTRNGVDAARITASSQGEKRLLTRDPRQFARNRRVELIFSTNAVPTLTAGTPDAVGRRNAQAALLAAVGPPYAAEKHFPRAAPGLNTPLPGWKWGSIGGTLRAEMNKWVADYVGHYEGDVSSSSQLNAMTVDGYTVEPRPIVEQILRRIESDAVAFLEEALGRRAN